RAFGSMVFKKNILLLVGSGGIEWDWMVGSRSTVVESQGLKGKERGPVARSNPIRDGGMTILQRWICARCCGSQSRGPLFGATCIFGFYYHYKMHEKL